MKTATYKDRLLHLGILALSVLLLGSCIDNGQTGNGAAIRFNVLTEHYDAPKTRSASGIIACTTDSATGSATDTVFLIEHEEAFSSDTGIPTRAEITTTISEKFSSIGYKGATSGAGISTTPWFYNAETNPNGTLVTPVYWWDTHPHARFFAIYPRVTASYPQISLSPENHPSTPYVDFEVASKVVDQKDLLTACSGEVHYATQGVQPRTDLKFRHALTAVRFKVGPNLSWNKKITKVEIINAKSKGRYTLPTDTTGIGAQWSNRSDPKTFTLTGDVSLKEHVDSLIIGKPGDTYTFYMIPQDLTGVSIKIYFDNNPTPAIAANLAGSWKPGTVKSYFLSQTTSDWQYKLIVTSPAAAAFNATSTGNYTIRSYRSVTGTEQPVAWRVVSYQESADGGATFGPETTVKPTWLTALSLEQGNGSMTGETGNATIQAAPLGDLAIHNQGLQSATPKGSPGNYYDLSTHDVNGNPTPRNTANCYLISAPGYYCIPLVYGNAVKNGVANTHAYISQAPTGTPNEQYVLRNFKDHAGQNINSPYINVQNASYPATQAGIVWTDQSGLVEASSLSVTNNGADSYVNFHVPDDKIKNGNAVIAVKNASGTVLWSWHLWFVRSDALNTIACTNFQGYIYNFTKLPLGSIYRRWEGTAYDKPRVARMKVEQTVANGGVKQVKFIDITQNPGSSIEKIVTTYYQFGRKDAMPSRDVVADGSFTPNGGNNMSIQNGIQHPGTFYTFGTSWWNGYGYCNLWSMDNTTIGGDNGFNDNPVVKTVYDPCPAGFKMHAARAFTGFTTTGMPAYNNIVDFNVSGAWDNGWHFNNKLTTPDATVYFPASGSRPYSGESPSNVYLVGFYWSAAPSGPRHSCYQHFTQTVVDPQSYGFRANGFSVRPVSE